MALSEMQPAFISEQTVGLLWIIWFTATIFIGIGSVVYFRMYPNVSLKRLFHRWFTIVYGAAFFLLIFSSVGASPALLLFGGGIVVITYLNIRNTNFCDACGKATYNHSWFSKVEFCARCGERLPQKH